MSTTLPYSSLYLLEVLNTNYSWIMRSWVLEIITSQFVPKHTYMYNAPHTVYLKMGF